MPPVENRQTPRLLPLQDRYSFVLDRLAGKNVLSVGLGGQAADTGYSFNLSTTPLAHTFSSAVAATAAHTTFVDILPEAVDAYRTVVDADFWLADICAPPETWPEGFRESRFDTIVLGEVIEHLPNPGAALVGLQEVLAPDGEFLISVPNAFCLARFGRMATGHERVHPEHVAYYSPSTLESLAHSCGLEVTEIGFYRTRRLNVRQLRSNPFGYLAGLIAERLPQYAKGVVATLRVAPK